MITKLRDAKGQLSELVKRAAGGEEIIITVRGEPMARLSAVQSPPADNPSRASFADELARLADAVRTDASATSPQAAWDELREERF